MDMPANGLAKLIKQFVVYWVVGIRESPVSLMLYKPRLSKLWHESMTNCHHIDNIKSRMFSEVDSVQSVLGGNLGLPCPVSQFLLYL